MHKRWKKPFCIGLILVSILTGCTMFATGPMKSATTDPAETNTDVSRQRTIIRVSHSANGAAKEIEMAMKSYNTKNKDKIQIEIIVIPSDKIDEVFNLLMASGDGPDVFGSHMEKMLQYSEKNWVADMSSYIDDSFLQKFPEAAVRAAKSKEYKGRIFSIPSIADTYRLVYNKDLFRRAGLNPEAPPETISQLREYAKKITDACKSEKKYGFALPLGEEWSAFNLGMEIPLTRSGITYFNYKEGKYDLTVYKPWLQTYIDMKNEGSLFPGETSLKNDNARAQFAEGNVGMMFAGSWDPGVYSYQFPAKCDWGVAMPPALDEKSKGKGALESGFSFAWGVNPSIKHLNESVKVWKYFYSNEFLGYLFKEGKVLPIVKGITDHPEYKPSLKNFDKFLPTGMDSIYPSKPQGINEGGRTKVYTSIVLGEVPIDKALKDETDRLNNLLREAVRDGRINLEDYKNPNFDCKNPLKP